MKLEKPINVNYCATVVKIKNIIPLEGCDNVVGTNIHGFQAIINKETQIGDIGIVFPAETQLSYDYAHHNNLHRHGDKNIDEGQKGYLDDNRRIRAVRFRGHTSSCLFMPLSSLNYVLTPREVSELEEGMEFDFLDGNEICRKYTIPVKEMRARALQEQKRFSRVDAKHMPEHNDSDNYHKWGDTIPADKYIIVTQKLHGTSIRIGHTVAKRQLTLIEKILSALGAPIAQHTYDYIYGSRKVIKDINNPYQNHYYTSDIWTREGEKLKGILPKNYLVYGELVGWVGDAAIQKNYTYGVPQGVAELYIYRIAFVNEDGFISDLSWEQVKEFCTQNALKHVPELWKGYKVDFDVNVYMDKRFAELGYPNVVPLSDPETVDEGVCVRVDGMRPRILKAKCQKFFEHETKLLDQGVVDLESSESTV